MRVTISWTEMNEHSADLEVPGGTDLANPDVRADLLDQALELTGTYLGTVDRVIDEVDAVDEDPPSEVKALIVEPGADGRVTVRRIGTGLRDLQSLVGGLIQPVQINNDVVAWCNEEGKLMGLPPNVKATALAGIGAYDTIVGTVVITGDSDGDLDDVPEYVISACRSLTWEVVDETA